MQRREAMRLDLEKSELLDCTFQPRITKKAQAIARRARHQGGDDHVEPGDQPQTRKKDKKVDTEAEADAEAGAEADTGVMAAHASSRLYEAAVGRQEHLRYQEARKEEEALYEHHFHPTINPATTAKFDRDINHRPIHERVGEVQRAHREHMQRLRENYLDEERKVTTFEPKIPLKSDALAIKARRYEEDGGGGGGADRVPSLGFGQGADRGADPSGGGARGISDRLLREGRCHTARMHKLREEALERESVHMQQARASKGSDLLAKKNADISAPFAQRQAIYEARKRGSAAMRAEERRQEERQWFRPSLDAKTTTIAAKVSAATTTTTTIITMTATRQLLHTTPHHTTCAILTTPHHRCCLLTKTSLSR